MPPWGSLLWLPATGQAYCQPSVEYRRAPVPARLRPSAPIAPDAVLVGDPGRALMLAQELLEQPKMANHARGLWGYWGQTPQGQPLTIQSTGIGAPSAAAVLGRPRRPGDGAERCGWGPAPDSTPSLPPATS